MDGSVTIGIIALVLLMQIATSVLHPSFKAVSKSAISAIVLLSVLGILLNVVGKYELPNFTYDETDSDAYHEALSRSTEVGIALEVAERYGIDDEKISVSLSGLDSVSMRAEHVYVRIDDVTVDYRSVREFVKENFLLEGGEIEVELRKQ